jgi:hypothetical protein
MHPFPLIRSGGLFVLIVGVSIVAGGVIRRRAWVLLAVGLALASVIEAATAQRLTAPLGRPTAFQIGSLIAAVVVEVIVIASADRWLRSANERQRTLWILIIVGTHFVLMAPAFGPLIALLGLLSILNAIAAFRATRIPLSVAWFIDGALKAAIGGVMLWFAPRMTW